MQPDPKVLALLAFHQQPVVHGAGADLNFSTAVALLVRGALLTTFIYRLHEYEPLYSFITTGFAILQGVLSLAFPGATYMLSSC